ncbi:type VI secretion system tip protein VgrG [Mucilaginibacter ginsenosidivorax]|uniref:Type VI secretion system tip protein VgrG n=1 Tax=Mucilaginibacter ginsenosidivorax TaxID=862126 RepID=A0A5B8W4T5_9SPHI|nr:type VI secretion system tip protein VgrG [Mucilaginibacter ginsenosidivorax]QEC77995.1 type VI secretion system tip protein VgrG [Mucilaginibacter ginsenosidivorax]
MLDSLPPGAAQATDLVTQKVLINGTALSTSVLLSRILVNKTFNKVSYAKIVFLDGSASDADFPLSDDDTYKPGNTVEIQLGYHGQTDTVFKGIIVKHAIKAKQNGASLLTIEAKDRAITLTANRNSAYYINQKDSNVITTLAGSLDTDIDDTGVTQPQLVQFDATNWDFILTRAEANGMLVLADDGKLVVKKPTTSGSPVLTATYGQSIFEFEAEMDARRQFSSVSSISWDYTQQQLEKSGPGSTSFIDNGNIQVSDIATVLNAQVQLNHPGHLTQQQLQNWSDSYELRNHLSKNVGRVRIQGNAKVKPGTMITLAGVGDRFNGNVFVSGIMHIFDGFWSTDVQFGWSEDWFYKKEDVMNKPTSGLLPGVNGLLIGTVLDVNDADQSQYRVKVQVPTITSGSDGIWARVATLDAGANRGTYFRPQATDEVILGFLNDDPREPVILGYLHSSSSKKSPLPVDSGAEQYGFVSKQGIKLIFDDTNSRLTLSVTTPTGQKSIILNDSSGAFAMTDENQNSIKMDPSGITIQAGTGNVIIKGTTVMIN